MFDLEGVQKQNRLMSDVELTRKDIHYIMKNYSKLKKRYGIGGVNEVNKNLKEVFI